MLKRLHKKVIPRAAKDHLMETFFSARDIESNEFRHIWSSVFSKCRAFGDSHQGVT